MTRILRRPLTWLVIAALLAVSYLGWMRWRGPRVRTTLVARRDLEQHLVASGRVRVPTRIQVAAQTGGLVVAVGVVEGQRVEAGDLLVQIDDGAERSAVAQAEAAVKQAKARVEQLKRVGAIVATEALRQAQTQLDRAQADFERARRLAASGAVPRVELENATRALEIAHAQQAAAAAQQVAAAPLGADSRIALTALLQAEAQLAGAQVQLGHTRLVARQGGTVLTRSVEPGDVVQPSRTLLVIAADADVQLVIQPDERNLAWLALGQPARASADAFPQRVFDATVAYIAPSVDPQRGSVEVRLAVPAPPDFLKPDMTVSVDLTVASRTAAVTVASAAVRDVTSARPWLLVVDGGRARRRDVQLGIRGEGAIEIVAGVAAGSEVVVPDGTPVAVGARVRAERD